MTVFVTPPQTISYEKPASATSKVTEAAVILRFTHTSSRMTPTVAVLEPPSVDLHLAVGLDVGRPSERALSCQPHEHGVEAVFSH